MTAEAKQRKHQRPQLRVVFDTNILFTDSASDLVRQEAVNLIKESTFPDLEIQWYLPEMVRHERQYQMQKRALELLPPIAKVERLLAAASGESALQLFSFENQVRSRQSRSVPDARISASFSLAVDSGCERSHVMYSRAGAVEFVEVVRD